MTAVRAIAFDGTPVDGGAGIREPILAQPDGGFSRAGGRRLTDEELEELVSGGYVTSVDPSLDSTASDPVVVYRHREFRFPGLHLETGFAFSEQGDIFAAMLDRQAAGQVLVAFAGAAALAARSALEYERFDQVCTFSRRGLMVVPGLRTSPLAAELYGLLLAAKVLSDSAARVDKEIRLMLDASVLPRVWATVAAALKRPWVASTDTRCFERELTVGTSVSPREVAA